MSGSGGWEKRAVAFDFPPHLLFVGAAKFSPR